MPVNYYKQGYVILTYPCLYSPYFQSSECSGSMVSLTHCYRPFDLYTTIARAWFARRGLPWHTELYSSRFYGSSAAFIVPLRCYMTMMTSIVLPGILQTQHRSCPTQRSPSLCPRTRPSPQGPSRLQRRHRADVICLWSWRTLTLFSVISECLLCSDGEIFSLSSGTVWTDVRSR